MKKFVLFLVGLFSGSSHVDDIRLVEDWERLYVKNIQKEYDIASQQSFSNDSWQFYNLAYYIDANTSMFQATGKTDYLDRAFFYIDNMIGSAIISKKLPNSQYKDSYMGWANTTAPSYKNDGKEYPLFESFCWRYVTYLLRILKGSPSILQIDAYKEKYEKVLTFTQTNIYEKWLVRGRSNLYRSNTHMFSHWARISLDLWEITGDEKYRAPFEEFNKRMRKQIQVGRIKGGSYIYWNSPWDKSKRSPQDVGHGNAVVSTIVEMYELGIGYNKRDIERLINMFNLVVWPEQGKFANYFDGSGNGKGWFTDGLIKLGRYDANLQKRIETHDRGRSAQFFGNGALNACILLNGKPVYPEL